MKKLFVQFKSGNTLKVEDICNYFESEDYDIVIARDHSRGNKKESHITIFHDNVEYMCVDDDIDDESEGENNEHMGSAKRAL